MTSPHGQFTSTAVCGAFCCISTFLCYERSLRHRTADDRLDVREEHTMDTYHTPRTYRFSSETGRGLEGS